MTRTRPAAPEGSGAVEGLDEYPLEQPRPGPASRDALRVRDLPKGVLLLGVPGTGKSLAARAIAGTWGLPLLRLEMARVLGSLVGQSEARTQGALRLAEAMAPCVLHVDEIEKALAGAGAGHLDSGVTSRVVGTLLTWLHERGLGRDGCRRRSSWSPPRTGERRRS